jgi:protein involved in polysaccharide export with SLBB domain
MKKLTLMTSLALGLVLILLAGCQHPGPRFDPRAKTANAAFESVPMTNRIDPALLQRPTNLFTLGPGDKVEIELLSEPASKTTTTVGPDGKIYFNLLSGLDVWGLTLAQAKARLEQELAQFIRDRVQVTLTLRAVESQRVWLLGRLQAPGVYPMATPMTLLEAIALAGGTAELTSTRDVTVLPSSEELADLRRSFVLRQGKLLPVNFDRLLRQGDLSQNIYLQADDFIYLPSAAAREVYVLGAVGQPKAVPYNEELTLVAAIANALGTIKDADWWQVALVRGSLSQPKVAIINYKAIVQGKEPDVKLEPQDIVYVPFTPWRYPYKYLDIVLQTFVSAVAINEGARAVTKQAVTPAGVFIPVGSRITVVPPTSATGR